MLDLFDLGRGRSSCHPGAPACVLFWYKVYVKKLGTCIICDHAPLGSAVSFVFVF